MHPDPNFMPPPLQLLPTPEELFEHMRSLYPDMQESDPQWREMRSSLEVYGEASREYRARCEVYSQWVGWYQQNPTGKDQFLAFVTALVACHTRAFTGLRGVADTVNLWIEQRGDKGNFGTIKEIVARVDAEAKNLALNLDAWTSASVPAGDAASASPTGPRPQKRTTG